MGYDGEFVIEDGCRDDGMDCNRISNPVSSSALFALVSVEYRTA